MIKETTNAKRFQGEEIISCVGQHSGGGSLRWRPEPVHDGLICLGLGLLFYLIARPSVVASFLCFGPQFSRQTALFLRILLGSAPTFIHTLAFSLITASIAAGTRRLQILTCAGWAVLEILFEAIQHPDIRAWLLLHFGLIDTISLLRRYVFGTFDYNDVAAAISGAFLATLILRRSNFAHEATS